MRKTSILLWVVILCLSIQSGQASITNDTQATGPFPDIDQAMASAQDGDHFTVSGSTGGGNITISDCRITGAVGPGTDIIGESVVSGASVTLEDLTFDAAGANANVLLISGNADVTANNCEFLNAGTAPAEINGVQVGDGIDPAVLIADGCLFSNSTLYNLNLESAGSSVTLTQCNVENSPNDAIHITGDGSVLKMTDSFIGNNLDVGAKSGANGTLMDIRNCDFNNNGSRHVETDSDYIDQVCNIIDCTIRGGADRVIRFKGDTGQYLLLNTFVDGNGESGIRLGDADSSTLNVINTCFYNTDRMIRVDGDPSGITGIGGNNTVNLDNSTFYLSGRGMVNETPATNPNTWNVNYCIVAQWDGTSRIGLENQDAASAFNENNNVLANTEPAAVVRSNVAPGANSVDDLQANAITNLFCDTNVLNADFLKALTTSAALNIDGVGGLAGGKTLCPATNPVVRGSDAAEFADVGTAVADAGTAAGESLYVTAAAGGGLVNKNDISVLGPGPVNTTALDVQATGILVQDIDLSGVGIGLGGTASTLTVNRSTIDGSGGAGINANSVGSTLNITGSEITNSGGEGIRNDSDGGVFSIFNSSIVNNNNNGIRTGGAGMIVGVTNSLIDNNAAEGIIRRSDASSFSLSNSTVSNSGGTAVPLSSREHGYRDRGNGNVGFIDNCTFFGNDSGVRMGNNPGNSITLTDSCVFNNGRGLRADDGGGSGFVTTSNCTFFGNAVGVQNETSGVGVNLGNTFDVQYCVLANWDESSSVGDFNGHGFADEVGDAVITENNNVYADSDVAASARLNVTPGPNSVDEAELGNVFCSIYPTNPLFLSVGINSSANDIDGGGGVAGCKPASCEITFTSSTASENANWSLYN